MRNLLLYQQKEAIKMTDLVDALDKARFVRVFEGETTTAVYVWHGWHTVHGYLVLGNTWTEIEVFSAGSYADDVATLDVVKTAIAERHHARVLMMSGNMQLYNISTHSSRDSERRFGVFAGATPEDAIATCDRWYRSVGGEEFLDEDETLRVEPIAWVELDSKEAARRYQASAAFVADIDFDDYLLAAVDAATGKIYYEVYYGDVAVHETAPTLDAAISRAEAILLAIVARLA